MNDLGKDENKENELRLPANLKVNPFSIPPDYFQSLEQSILLNTKISKLSDSVFTTPADYQSELTNDLLTKISEENLRSNVSQEGFTIPQGYFKESNEEILKQTVLETKVIPIKKSRTAWLAYASAACVAIAVSLFTLFQVSDSNENKVEQVNIDVLKTEEIINYLAFYSETGDLISLSDQLSDGSVNFADSFSSDEIESYLENSI